MSKGADSAIRPAMQLSASVIKTVKVIRQPCVFKRPLRPEIACLARDLPADTAKAIESDHATHQLQAVCEEGCLPCAGSPHPVNTQQESQARNLGRGLVA
jgi:hypothetical protein